MRIVMQFVEFALVSALLLTNKSVAQDCISVLSASYEQATMDEIAPQEWPRSVVRIKMESDVFGKKYFLISNGKVFSLITATPLNAVATLHTAASACKLPANPVDAAELIQVQWKTQTLTEREFQSLRDDLLQGLNSQLNRFRQVSERALRTGEMTVAFHSQQFSISMESSQISYRYTVVQHDEPDPLISWARNLMAFSDSPKRKSSRVPQHP